MTSSSPHIPERRELAAALRRLREDAQLSTPRLAVLLGWSQSRVSRVERGATLATAADVEAWGEATKADPDTRRHLMTLAESGHVQLTEWRRELAPGRRRVQEEIAQHEAHASVLRIFGADVVPGLAQTRAYAAAMLRLGRDVDEVDDLDAILDARAIRTRVLDGDKQIHMLMSEFALHRRLLSGDEHRAQLQHLVELTHKPNVHLGVIPFAATERVHQYHGYAILGDPAVDQGAVVLAETLTRGLRIRSADEIAEYIAHYRELDATAVHDDQLRALLQEVAEGATWS